MKCSFFHPGMKFHPCLSSRDEISRVNTLLDKIYFCFAVMKIFKHAIKNRLWHRCFQVSFAKFLRIPFFTEHFWATASKQVTVPLQGLQTAKPLISSCRRTGKTILSNYWQNPKITATAHYFIIILIIIITIITFITIVKCTFTV